jgi:thymidine phosphorylase
LEHEKTLVTPHLRARRAGIDTHHEPVVFLNRDSSVARSEGLESHTRVQIHADSKTLIATLNVVDDQILPTTDVGLSEEAWRLLDIAEGDPVWIQHLLPVESFSHVRAKIYGHRLNETQMREIVSDISARHYSNVEIAAFVTSCADQHLDGQEIVYLTTAMVNAGQRLSWGDQRVADKHCVGGLPGNRTTPIVVAIAAANGILIPKTSSRAITSPSGTADCMETLTRVDLSLRQMRNVVETEGGCLAWGGSVNLSPADDLLIRVEQALDIDSEGQLIASVLSKKIAAGSTDVLIDVPVGPTAKVRSHAAFELLREQMQFVARHLGLNVRVLASDGSQPIGRALGPALEARDVLAVLNDDPHAPVLLRDKSIDMAAELLEMFNICAANQGRSLATETLAEGRALDKFLAICRAQGGIKEPPVANHQHQIQSSRAGRLSSFDNRRLARVAKLAGAPADPSAGLVLHAKLDDLIEAGQPLLTLHAESPGELAYALRYYQSQTGIIQVSTP